MSQVYTRIFQWLVFAKFRGFCPNPILFENPVNVVPKGQNENSPAFQRRDGCLDVPSPVGTVESGTSALFVQSSLRDLFRGWLCPGVETPGYFREVPPGLSGATRPLHYRKVRYLNQSSFLFHLPFSHSLWLPFFSRANIG